MKKLLKSGIFLMVMTLILGPTFVHSFNSATHIYIADQVFPNCIDKINLYYGSIAPDLALYVANQSKWSTAFGDTHYDYKDLRPYAWSSIQKAFAKGWLTHNEEWGADHYAHIGYPINSGTNGIGYVIEKAQSLSDQTGLDPEFAHFVIEVAIDLLLKNDDPKLGEKLLSATLLRSWQDRNLLANVLVWQARVTDWVTLASAELTFRNLVGRYAMAFALPIPYDKYALANLGVQLAEEMYGITVTEEQLLSILEIALNLCNDYKGIIDAAIEEINQNK